MTQAARLPVTLLACLLLAPGLARAQSTLRNLSIDGTQALYADLDPAFARSWQQQTGHSVSVLVSHGESAAQVHALISGQAADVVSLADAQAIDELAYRDILARDWQSRLPNGATPATSTVVFLVRPGNPRRIHDWADLIRPGLAVIAPDPRTSGAGRWDFLAALAWNQRQPGISPTSGQDFLLKLYRNVPNLGARAGDSMSTFLQQNKGDVLLALEVDALAERAQGSGANFDVVYPSVSIRVDFPVSVVDSVVLKDGNQAVAEAYLKYLWTPEAQGIEAKHFFRPRDPAIPTPDGTSFAKVETVGIEAFGGWPNAQVDYFAENGLFARIAAEIPWQADGSRGLPANP